jgi:hypothetical protein
VLEAKRRANEQDSDGTAVVLRVVPALLASSGLTAVSLLKLHAMVAMVLLWECCT